LVIGNEYLNFKTETGKVMLMGKPLEGIFWSIALPGFGQLLNGKVVKGIVFIVLELIINVQSGFNGIILLSFLGETELALSQTNFQWLMFYPCIYFYAMWDAYRDAGGVRNPFAFFPFVFAAYFVTVGLMYSSKVMLFGKLLGPVWLPMLFTVPGVIIGFLILKIATKMNEHKK
jgi:hypothetical protein